MSSRDDTTRLVREAKAGDAAGLEALVERLSPLLLAQARFRMGSRLPGIDPEEVVQEVWLRSLPRLPELGERGGRHTPTLVRFLATTLLHLVNELIRSEIRAQRRSGHATSDAMGVSKAPDDTIGVVSRVLRSEREHALGQAIEALDARDRELVVLRGIEQHANQEVAELLGETPNAVSLRFNRLLAKLRSSLRGSVLDELGDD